MENCIFCKIIKGEIPSSKVYEDAKTFAFLDIAPVNKGHCLIVPKKHSADLHGMSEEDAGACINTAKKLCDAMSKALGTKSFNVFMNNGKEAGQVVFHSHIHVVPRFEDDKQPITWHHTKYEGNEMKEFMEKIRKSFQ